MATTFLEPGGDADFQNVPTGPNALWSFAFGTTLATDFVHGNHIKSIKIIHGSSTNLNTPSGVCPDAGTRISFYVYFNVLPSVTITFAQVVKSDGTSAVFRFKITSGGVIQLFATTSQIGTNGGTLSAGKWYRISIAYNITSTSTNRFELFINGVSSISITNATLINTVGDSFNPTDAGDSTIDFRLSDFYIDNSSSLTDTGDIWVTAKRPNANGTTNGFTTQIGAGGSGYGAGHSPQVNERALSTTNGWSMVGAGSAITEEYNIEGKSIGDINISGASIIDWLGWVSVKALAGTPTIQIILNGVNNAQTINTTATMYTKIKGSSIYPSGTGADIGIVTDTSLTTESLYECGVLVAYIPGDNKFLRMF